MSNQPWLSPSACKQEDILQARVLVSAGMSLAQGWALSTNSHTFAAAYCRK